MTTTETATLPAEGARSIHLSVLRWRDKVNGNSYFAARIYADGREVLRLPFQYGYGNQPEAEAVRAAREAGLLPAGRACYLGSACRELGIAFTSDDNKALKRDVRAHGAALAVLS